MPSTPRHISSHAAPTASAAIETAFSATAQAAQTTHANKALDADGYRLTASFWFYHLLYWLCYLLLKFTHLATLIPLEDNASSWPFLFSYTVVVGCNIFVTALLAWQLSRQLCKQRLERRSGQKTQPHTVSPPNGQLPNDKPRLAQQPARADHRTSQQLRHLLYWLLPWSLCAVWLRYDMLHLWQVEDIYGGRAAALVNTYMLVLLPLLGWLAGVLLFFSHQRHQQQRQQAQLLLHQAKSARLKILRYQLDPHFMFNTLNALNALIVSRDDGQIERLIDNLSVFLRHSLHEHPSQQVPLTQELAALEAYLIIQQLRFGDRLQLHWQQASLPPLQLPPLLLQPLAEFSIQQGVTTQPGLRQLRFDIQLQPPWLQLQFISGARTDMAEKYGADITPQSATHSATHSSKDNSAKDNSAKDNSAEPELTAMPPAQWPEALQQLNERLILLFGHPSQLYVWHGAGVFKSGFYLPMEALDVRI